MYQGRTFLLNIRQLLVFPLIGIASILGSCDNDPYCPKGLSWCWAQCVDFQNDNENCGSCDNQCGELSSCQNGKCTCEEGYRSHGRSRCVPEVEGFCSDSGWCWQNPLPQGVDLNDIWGARPDDVWVVGYSGTILHWDGTVWTVSDSGVDENLFSIWGFGDDDIWSVGSGGTVLHWDGERWAQVESGTDDSLSGVWGPDRSELWAVGGTFHPYYGPRILHWKDEYWSDLSIDERISFGSVWGLSSKDVWMSGSGYRPDHDGGGMTLHWDGDELSLFETEPMEDESVGAMSGFWGLNSGDIWSVGGCSIIVEENIRTHAGCYFHWDGKGWSTYQTSNLFFLSGIWGTAEDNVWAVGWRGHSHWDGNEWEETYNEEFYGKSIWGRGSDVWTVGAYGQIYYWDGRTWDPVSDSYTWDVSSMWGTDPGNVWAVGGNGSDGGILHWDGESWTRIDSEYLEGRHLYSVWGTDANSIWISAYGDILYWNGSFWTIAAEEIGTSMRDVHGTSHTDVWAVGGVGYITHWNGNTWSNVPADTSRSLYGVWAIAPDDAWAVGGRYTILHWDGNEWLHSEESGSELYNLHDVWSIDADNVWAVGESGTVLQWERSTGAWERIDIGAEEILWKIWGSDANDIWISGSYGLYHWNGDTWSKVEIPEARGTGVWGLENEVWVFGYGGAILHHSN